MVLFKKYRFLNIYRLVLSCAISVLFPFGAVELKTIVAPNLWNFPIIFPYDIHQAIRLKTPKLYTQDLVRIAIGHFQNKRCNKGLINAEILYTLNSSLCIVNVVMEL